MHTPVQTLVHCGMVFHLTRTELRLIHLKVIVQGSKQDQTKSYLIKRRLEQVTTLFRVPFGVNKPGYIFQRQQNYMQLVVSGKFESAYLHQIT